MSEPLRVIYAGNLGLAQGVGTLVEAATQLGPRRVVVTIAGDGAERDKLMRLVVERAVTNVHLIGTVPRFPLYTSDMT